MNFDAIGNLIYELIRFIWGLIWGWITLVLNIAEKPFLWLFTKDPKTVPGKIAAVVTQGVVVIIMLLLLILVTYMMYKLIKKTIKAIKDLLKRRKGEVI